MLALETDREVPVEVTKALGKVGLKERDIKAIDKNRWIRVVIDDDPEGKHRTKILAIVDSLAQLPCSLLFDPQLNIIVKPSESQ
jgi:transposase